MLNALHDLLSQLSGFSHVCDNIFPLNETPWFVYVVLSAALIVALSIHEFGHAWMADKLGDPGPREAGRLTLSPVAHLDPLGTLLIVASTLIGMPIGWGKPVKTDPDLYTVDRRTGIGLVALAGPCANMLTAIALAAPCRFLLFLLSEYRMDPTITMVLVSLFLFLVMMMFVSLSLFTFNLVPLYPLDGSHVLASLLPQEIAAVYIRFMKRYGIYFFLTLLASGILSKFLSPVVVGLFRLLLGV